MADENKDSGAPEGGGDEAPKKPKFTMLQIALAAQTLVILAATGVIAKFVLLTKKAPLTQAVLTERAIASVRDIQEQVKVVDLKEFVVNLPDRRTIKAHIQIEVSNNKVEEALASRMPAIRARVLDVLSAADTQKTEGIQGKLLLKDNIRTVLNEELLKNKVSAKTGIVRDVFFVELFLI